MPFSAISHNESSNYTNSPTVWTKDESEIKNTDEDLDARIEKIRQKFSQNEPLNNPSYQPTISESFVSESIEKSPHRAKFEEDKFETPVVKMLDPDLGVRKNKTEP